MDTVLIDEPRGVAPSTSRGGDANRPIMKLVSCVIRPERLETVRDALDQLHVVGGMTVTDVRGFGRQKGHVEHYRGEEYTVRLLPKVKLEIVIKEQDLDLVLQTLRETAQTGQVGDGKAFILGVGNAVRIRTGEQGSQAL